MRKPNNQGVRKTSSGYLTSSRCSLTSHLSKSLLVFLTRRAHITSSTHSVSLMTFVPPKQREWRFGRKPQHHQIGARGRAHALVSPMLHPRPSYPTSLGIIPSCISSPVKFDPLLLVSAVQCTFFVCGNDYNSLSPSLGPSVSAHFSRFVSRSPFYKYPNILTTRSLPSAVNLCLLLASSVASRSPFPPFLAKLPPKSRGRAL